MTDSTYRHTRYSNEQFQTERDEVLRTHCPVQGLIALIVGQRQHGRVTGIPIMMADMSGRPEFADMIRVMLQEEGLSGGAGYVTYRWGYLSDQPNSGLVTLVLTFTRPVADTYQFYFRVPEQLSLLQAIADADGELAIGPTADPTQAAWVHSNPDVLAFILAEARGDRPDPDTFMKGRG